MQSVDLNSVLIVIANSQSWAMRLTKLVIILLVHMYGLNNEVYHQKPF